MTRVLAFGAMMASFACGQGPAEDPQPQRLPTGNDAPVLTTRDHDDLAIIRAWLDLPNALRVTRYHGFPAEVGWGQREGLQIDATLQAPADQMTAVRAAITEHAGWRQLPVPRDTARRVNAIPWDATSPRGYEPTFRGSHVASGVFRCLTAGHDILGSSHHPLVACENRDTLADYILAVFDPSTGELHVRVKCAY